MRAVISIANQKGGVGKTTTAVNLSGCLAGRGERVLLIDLDGQGNATSHLGVEIPESEDSTSYALLATAEPDVEKLAVPVASNLLLIPGHIALAEVDIKLFSQINRDTRLARAILPFADDVDFVQLRKESTLRSGWTHEAQTQGFEDSRCPQRPATPPIERPFAF